MWGHCCGDTLHCELCLLEGTVVWTVPMGTQSYTPDLWGLDLETVLMGTHGKTPYLWELVGQCV